MITEFERAAAFKVGDLVRCTWCVERDKGPVGRKGKVVSVNPYHPRSLGVVFPGWHRGHHLCGQVKAPGLIDCGWFLDTRDVVLVGGDT